MALGLFAAIRLRSPARAVTPASANRKPSRARNDRGIGLILVMLALLVLSVLAAAIVFTARSETFASYNYKLDTEADYVAKAGIQEAVNWFRSARYKAVPQNQAAAYYNASPDGSTLNLYTSNTQPVRCISGCPSTGGPVELIGYGSKSSNYAGINDAGGTAVATAFARDLVNVRVTGDANNSGTFSINAVLLSYQTVNVATPTCSDGITPPPCPIETWLITSQGTWTGAAGQTGTIATAEEQAIVQSIYVPIWGQALYGYCSVTMNGSAGVCTDSFNSALGQYAGGNNKTAAGGCDSVSSNVIAAGAGVGANGSVTLGSNVSVAGNVTIGTGAAPTCGTGYKGSTSSVLGEVVNGPYQAPPAVPVFRSGFPSGAPSYSSSQVLPLSVKTWPNTFPATSYASASGANVGTTPPLPAGGPCMDNSCDGSQAHPFEVSSISIAGTDKIQLVGGPDVAHPVYYEVDSLSEAGNAEIDVSGYVVLNLRTSISITGSGVTNGISGTVDIPPASVGINYAGTNPVSIGGSGAVSALITAPNATVNLGGGGSKGYMVGAINAGNVVVQGGYPIHYDMQLNRLGGGLSVMTVASYGRKKI